MVDKELVSGTIKLLKFQTFFISTIKNYHVPYFINESIIVINHNISENLLSMVRL